MRTKCWIASARPVTVTGTGTGMGMEAGRASFHERLPLLRLVDSFVRACVRTRLRLGSARFSSSHFDLSSTRAGPFSETDRDDGAGAGGGDIGKLRQGTHPSHPLCPVAVTHLSPKKQSLLLAVGIIARSSLPAASALGQESTRPLDHSTKQNRKKQRRPGRQSRQEDKKTNQPTLLPRSEPSAPSPLSIPTGTEYGTFPLTTQYRIRYLTTAPSC